MLSKEFLKEAPQINPATGDPYTPAERDAEYEKTKAQGAKNLQGIKDFGNKLLGRTPAPAAPAPAAPAPAAPAANPEAELDPAIMRARYDQEAAARKAAPADAAPPPPGGAVAPVPSPTITATELPPPIKSFAEPAATGTAPAPMKGGYGSGMNNPSVAPKTAAAAAAAAPATDAAAQYAAADAGRAAVKSTETNPELKSAADKELAQIKSNAGLPKTEKAINPETGEEYDKLAPDDGPEQLGLSPEQIAAANAPRTEKAINPETGEEYNKLATAQSANDGDAGEELAKIKANAGLAQSANDDKAGEAEAAAAAAPAPAVAAAPEAPAPVKAFAEPEAPAAPAAPAAPVDTDTRRPGQLNPADAGKYKGVPPPATRTAAKSDPTVKALQDKLIAAGAKIKPDGVMGPATQAAMKQFPQASAPAAATRSAASGTVASAGGGRGFVNPTAANTAAAVAAAKPAGPAKPVAVAAAKLPAPQTGAAGQAARAASGKAPTQVAARQSTAAVMESQEISRMRFLAGLSKD